MHLPFVIAHLFHVHQTLLRFDIGLSPLYSLSEAVRLALAVALLAADTEHPEL